jgi:hypothetical protein
MVGTLQAIRKAVTAGFFSHAAKLEVCLVPLSMYVMLFFKVELKAIKLSRV